jgi:single-strand DNA-binding protein
MANYNKVILAANLVSDPELKTIGESNVVRFRVAINRRYTTKSGEKREDSTYIDCEMWGNRASIISTHLKKGDPILIEGHLKQENWESKDGEKRSKILISVEDFEFMGGGNKNENESSHQRNATKKQQKQNDKLALELEDVPF